MAKGLFGGMTDYSHQSFADIIHDLEHEQKNVIVFLEKIEQNLKTVTDNGFWNKKVISNFQRIVAFSIKHYKTAKQELAEIASEIQIEVREHHCKRLHKIANVAHEINVDIGKTWHQDYEDHGVKDYDDANFRIVENIYKDTRDMAVNLLDLSNIASRLEDYIGKTTITMEKNQNLGGISNASFGDNATIIVGDNNQVKTIQIKTGNFDDLRQILTRNNVADSDIAELKTIIESENPDTENNRLGEKTNGWIAKMVNKCLDGSWAIGIGAAGKLLADGIKAYYGLFPTT